MDKLSKKEKLFNFIAPFCCACLMIYLMNGCSYNKIIGSMLTLKGLGLIVVVFCMIFYIWYGFMEEAADNRTIQEYMQKYQLTIEELIDISGLDGRSFVLRKSGKVTVKATKQKYVIMKLKEQYKD